MYLKRRKFWRDSDKQGKEVNYFTCFLQILAMEWLLISSPVYTLVKSMQALHKLLFWSTGEYTFPIKQVNLTSHLGVVLVHTST